jgi:hypothetical protein
MTDFSPYQPSGQKPTIGPSEMTAEEFSQLAEMIAEALVEGEDRGKLAQDLINGGWNPNEAQAFVSYVEDQLFAEHHQQAQPTGDYSWLLWIGGLIGFNVLSHIFGWGITIF